ncbi:MAG: 4-hydroxy-tetrahydrodipicolinate synthase, partial [Chlamydiae bacterium]|nr:4-hydroxy-tetrahydrodipicolinate synthase [Chlamydiota bacterium]
MKTGSWVAMVTPFDASGEVDYDCFRKLIRWHEESKTQGIVICGTTGEVSNLTEEEQFSLLQVATEEVKGKIPLIMGIGTNSTLSSLRRVKIAQEMGADAGLAIVPYYNRPSFEGCYLHFSQLAKEGLPLIVYHHPGRTGVRFSAEQLCMLCSIPGVIGIKDSSGDLDLMAELATLSRTLIFSGDDTLTLPMIAVGAVGVISVAANVLPSEMNTWVNECVNGNYQEAREHMRAMFPLFKSLALDSNPQGIKY